jgi:hypothetical protein
MGRFFRNPRTGEVVVAQWPNPPLWIFLGATALRLVLPDGTPRAIAGAVGRLALAWWAVDELVRGDSPFRRVLGGVVIAALVVSLFR